MHIAIIMDGNGRWAARRRLPRTAGHRAGATAVNTIVEAAARRRVGMLTLYAFSSGNWQRPHGEVSALFGLFERHLLTQTRRCLEQSIRINVIGRRDRLSPRLLGPVQPGRNLPAVAARRGNRSLALRRAPGRSRSRVAAGARDRPADPHRWREAPTRAASGASARSAKINLRGPAMDSLRR